MGIVYLIGAGPGDAGLITVKGAEKLKECDAVVYDHLACVELLSTIRPDCKKIYVGKQAGHHSFQQGEINQILVECAQTCATVVRLKGATHLFLEGAAKKLKLCGSIISLMQLFRG